MKEFNKSGVRYIETLEKVGKNYKILCECPLCHNNFEMWSSHYYRGTNSCECKNIAKINKRLYRIYINIKTRCYNTLNPNYAHYGARGITMCKEWREDYLVFMNWALANSYQDNLTIDRIDNDGNYEPSNCRWVNLKTQANNKSTNVFFYVNGIKFSFSELCNEFGLKYKTEHTYYSRHGIECEKERLRNKIDKEVELW